MMSSSIKYITIFLVSGALLFAILFSIICSHASQAHPAKPYSRPKNKAAAAQQVAISKEYLKHMRFIKQQGLCRIPQLTVIRVAEEMRDGATKQYQPRCTLLHRCSDQVGCCAENERCAAVKEEDVEVPFLIKELTFTGDKESFVMLTLKNHTECACVEINNMPR